MALTKDGGEVDECDDPTDDLQLFPRQMAHVVSERGRCAEMIWMYWEYTASVAAVLE